MFLLEDVSVMQPRLALMKCSGDDALFRVYIGHFGAFEVFLSVSFWVSA